MPSTAWVEMVGVDEAARHAAAARDIAALQQRKNARFGVGRALHRKGLLCTTAELEVLPGLPAHAAQGLFAQPGRYPVWVRLSNGGVDKQSDRRPDIRGFAFRVQGLAPAPSALGGTIEHQDFSLINQTHFAFATSHPFFGLVLAAGESPGALLKWMFRTYGLIGGIKQIKKMAATFGRPFAGFACERFASTLPIAFGPYAAKLRLLPPPGLQPRPDAAQAWAADFRAHTANSTSGPLVYELQAQFFENEASTPIEDASVEWLERDAPFVSLARLHVNAPPADAVWQQQAEASVYDPWQALAAHRPLGEVMRARKVVYFESQKVRGAA
jgi:hypothetical protein